MKVGFIINPIAGMGGKVGLKGTDDLADLAKELGGEPVSLRKAQLALQSIEDTNIFFLTCSGKMGESVLEKTLFDFKVIYHAPEKTTAQDTINAALKMLEANCDLILFSGGDGTARDVISAVDMKIPILGILEFTPNLHIDTGDHELDEKLRGYIKVLSGYHDFKMMKVV